MRLYRVRRANVLSLGLVSYTGQWYRAYGNENWEFDQNGLMQKRYASINDLKIDEGDRRL